MSDLIDDLYSAGGHIVDAVEDSALGVGHAVAGAADVMAGGAVQLAAGAAYAFDATDTAESLHETAVGLAHDDAREQFGESGDAFSDAGREIYNP